MQQTDGLFESIETIAPDFGSAKVVFFYATADGTIADPFDTPRSYPGGKTLTLEMTFDEFPEEVSIRVFSGLDEIWFRPYRYYINESSKTVTEKIPVPNEFGEYSIAVRDASGDGIGSTAYKVSFGNEVLLEVVFDSGGSSGGDFSVDPSLSDTNPPTVSPTPVTPTAGQSPTDSETATPTEDPGNGTPRDSPPDTSGAPDIRLGWTGVCSILVWAALSMVL